MGFENQDTAIREFGNILKKRGEQIINTKTYNHGRHWLLTTHKENYYVIYKRLPFVRFADIFKSFIIKNPEYKGIAGETINLTSLEKAIEKDSLLVFIYSNNLIKKIYPKFFKNYAKKHQLIRTQNKNNLYNKSDYSGERELKRETTASVPFSLLEDF